MRYNFNFKRYLNFFYCKEVEDFLEKRSKDFLDVYDECDVSIDDNNVIFTKPLLLKQIGSAMLLKKGIPVNFFVFDINNLVNLHFDNSYESILNKLKDVKYLFLYSYSLLNHSYLDKLFTSLIVERLSNNLKTTIILCTKGDYDLIFYKKEIKDKFKNKEFFIKEDKEYIIL